MPSIIVSVFFSPDLVLAQAAGRNVNLRMDDVILVAALFGLLIRHAAGRQEISIRTPLDKPILIYCAVGLISTLLGIYLGKVPPLRGFFFFAKRVEYFLLLYLLYYCLEGEREIKIAIYLLLACALGISIHGVYMRIAAGQAHGRGFSPLGGSVRVTEYAEILVLIVPIAIAIAIEKRSFVHTLPLPFAMFFMIYFLLDTLRRTAMVGMAMAILFITMYKYLALLPLLAGAVLYFGDRLPENIARRIAFFWVEVSQYPHKGGSLGIRIAGVRQAITSWFYRPLVGTGLGSYTLGSAVAHNQYAHILLETGILGLGAFFWFIALIAKLCWNGIKNTTDRLHRGFCIGFLAGILGWLVMNMGTISFTSIRTMNCFMIVTVILVAYSKIPMNEERQRRA